MWCLCVALTIVNTAHHTFAIYLKSKCACDVYNKRVNKNVIAHPSIGYMSDSLFHYIFHFSYLIVFLLVRCYTWVSSQATRRPKAISGWNWFILCVVPHAYKFDWTHFRFLILVVLYFSFNEYKVKHINVSARCVCVFSNSFAKLYKKFIFQLKTLARCYRMRARPN